MPTFSHAVLKRSGLGIGHRSTDPLNGLETKHAVDVAAVKVAAVTQAGDVLLAGQSFETQVDLEVVTNGDIEFVQHAESDLTVGQVNAGTGSIFLVTLDGDLHLVGSVIAGDPGSVWFTSSENVVLDGDTFADGGLVSIEGDQIRGPGQITSQELALRATNGIGIEAPLNSRVRRVAAVNSDSGSIQLHNSVGGLLTVGEVDGVAGVLNLGHVVAGGDIVITNHSPLTVTSHFYSMVLTIRTTITTPLYHY